MCYYYFYKYYNFLFEAYCIEDKLSLWETSPISVLLNLLKLKKPLTKKRWLKLANINSIRRAYNSSTKCLMLISRLTIHI